MKTLKRLWKRRKRLERGDTPGLAFDGNAPSGIIPNARSTVGQARGWYAITAYEALASFRFFTFAMGAGLAIMGLSSEEATGALITVLVVTGLFNVARVLWPADPVGFKALIPRAALALDLALAIALLLLTGGLNSPFLIYSLSPILTAALLMDVQSSIGAAGVSALSLAGAYVGGSLGLGGFPSILTQNYLALALLYSAVCLLSAYLPFLANLNWSSHLQLLAQESERQHLREEVHDNVAQTLAFLSLKMKWAESQTGKSRNGLTARDFSDVAKAVEESYLAVRDYLDGVEDREGDEPLRTRLASVANRLRVDTRLPVRLAVTGRHGQIPNRVEFQLLQIAREALANAAKHASPSAVWVELNYENSKVTLRVRDNGIGFSASQPRGHGLNIMSERAAKIGASLTISSAPQQGTEVAVVYPDSGRAAAP